MGNSVKVENSKKSMVIEDVDRIVVATGMKNYIPFDLKGEIKVYTIGDAHKVGKAQDAIREAYEISINL